MSWIRDFGKIRGIWSSIDQIKEQMVLDIQSYTTRPSRWSRCQENFVELWRQSSSKSSLNTKLLSEDKRPVGVAVPNIFVLFCNDYRPFHLSHDVIKIDEFSDVKHCFNSIQDGVVSSIFLIVCISSIEFCEEVKPLMKLDSVHATYIFSNSGILNEFQTLLTDDNLKLSGIFGDCNDIVLQLTNDICFYREIPFHIPKITILRPDVNSIEQLNQQEIDFVRFQLFVDILPRISLITDSCLELQTCISTDSTNSLFYHLINNSIFGQVINELFNQCDLLTLLEASSLLRHTDQQLATLALESDAFPITVYRVQLVGKENLEMMRHNINSLLTIHTFTLFSRSFSSVMDICRQSMNNGLIVVLFEIEVSENTNLVKIDFDTFAFRLGSVFRILSIDQMPDGIWHVQLELIDCAINQIHEQLQFEIDVRDIWLTFGNYMTALKQFEEAEIYYEYLLRNISPKDSCRSSIYNNIGLMYSGMNNEEKALSFFEQASQAFIESDSAKTEENNFYSSKQQSIPDSEFHPATLYGKIAEKYDRQGDSAKALDYYRKALEAAPDLTTNHFYQAAIKRTRKKLSVL
jgi:tetratricopeptide (TPR) repeat protein